jgi:hypothetical protein
MSQLLTLSLTLALIGQVPAQDESTFAAEAPARLITMKKSVSEYDIRLVDGPDSPFKLLTDPVLRFTNPVGRSRDGTVFLWVDSKGKPFAVAQASLNRRGLWVHEFSSLSPGPLVAKSSKGTVWKPGQRGVEFKPVPDAPKPAATAEKRLLQMRAILRDFAVEDHFQEQSWQGLRLLPKPFARWEDGPTDGALFAYVLTTDPEAYLMLEAKGGEGDPVWSYAFAPSTTYALRANWKGKEVWSKRLANWQTQPSENLYQFTLDGQ